MEKSSRKIKTRKLSRLEIKNFEKNKERYELSKKDYKWLMKFVKKLGIPLPVLDLMASRKNKKTLYFLDEKYDSLKNDFVIKRRGKRVKIPKSSYLNSPHKQYKFAVIQCNKQWRKYGKWIVAIIPSRNERSIYWHEEIEKNRYETNKNGHIFYFPLRKQFFFEIDGKPATDIKGRIMHDPNGYKLVIWIDKAHLKTFKKNIQSFYKWYNSLDIQKEI